MSFLSRDRSLIQGIQLVRSHPRIGPIRTGGNNLRILTTFDTVSRWIAGLAAILVFGIAALIISK